MGAVCCRPQVPSSAPSLSALSAHLSFLQVIDFDGDVNLFHFVLLRCVGKGAFGKVCLYSIIGGSFSQVSRMHVCLGQVRVVQHKQTKELYALKYINKPKCVKMKAVPNIIQERRLLEEVLCNFTPPFLRPPISVTRQVDHPFVVNLRYAFQDDENCFFVLDLMLGGDLRCVCIVLFLSSI